MLTISDMRNQNIDKTPYNDEQLSFVTFVLNNIAWPWEEFTKDNVSIKTESGTFGKVFVLYIDNL
jgi:hypothetical protein